MARFSWVQMLYLFALSRPSLSFYVGLRNQISSQFISSLSYHVMVNYSCYRFWTDCSMWIYYTLISLLTCLALFCFIQLHIIVVYVVINADLFFKTFRFLLTRCIASLSVGSLPNAFFQLAIVYFLFMLRKPETSVGRDFKTQCPCITALD